MVDSDSNDEPWVNRNTMVRLIDGNILAAAYVGVNDVHKVRHGNYSTELTSHLWRLADGSFVICLHPIGDGINRPMEVKKEYA
jgi:hypothetical protein